MIVSERFPQGPPSSGSFKTRPLPTQYQELWPWIQTVQKVITDLNQWMSDLTNELTKKFTDIIAEYNVLMKTITIDRSNNVTFNSANLSQINTANLGRVQTTNQGLSNNFDLTLLGNQEQGPITFGNAFSGTPIVICSLANQSDTSAIIANVGAFSITNTQFNLRINVTTPGAAGSTVKIAWVALGP